MLNFYLKCANVCPKLIKGRLCLFDRLFSSASINIDTIKPRRAILYVPGNDRRKIEKIRSVDVDCAVLDCEDGVAINKKQEARQIISELDNSFDFGRTEYAVRINSIGSGLAEEDLKTILNGKRMPDTIMIPKVEDLTQVEWIHDILNSHMKDRQNTKTISIIFFIESARSLLNLNEICSKALAVNSNLFKLEGLVFGSDDFCADIGATRSTEGYELLTARQMFVMIAKCYRLQAIDMVHINYKDLNSLSKAALEGAQMGFTGKQVIHPSQVSIVQKAFAPSEEKIKWAMGLVQQFKIHQKEGKGAFTYNGAMIDRPLLLQAENIIKIAEIINK